MSQQFREPTSEMPEWVNASFSDVHGAAILLIRDPRAMDAALLSVAQAEALLRVLLDICPNAHAIAGARKIRPLTNFDCDLIIEAANYVHSYTRDNVRARIGDILAERGIEVGE